MVINNEIVQSPVISSQSPVISSQSSVLGNR